MKEEYTKVDFINKTNPSSGFELIPIDRIKSRKYVDHTPFDYHQLEFFIIIYFTAGRGSHTIDFIDYECSEGTILVIRKDQIHKFWESTLDGHLVAFTMEFLGSFFEDSEAQKSLLLFNEFLVSPRIQLNEEQSQLLNQIIERLCEEYDRVNDDLSPSIIRSELQILISKLYRLINKDQSLKHDKKYLSEFIQFQKLVEEKHTETLKVKDYALWLGVSTKTLNTITSSILNKNAKEFINEICVNHIKRKLINTNLSAKEICYDMGFKETSNFYTYFKKNTGLTPEDYRQRNK